MGMLTEYYLQPDAPDPVLSEAEALRCVRRFVVGAKSVTAVDESGGEARTYVIDDALILKVQRPQQVRVGTSLAREVFFLHQIADAAPDLPVPRVLGYARETNLLEYNIQTRMPGVAVEKATLAPERRTAAIFAVGRFLRRLHGLAQKPLRDSAHFPADHTAADFRTRLGRYFDMLSRRLDASERPWPVPLRFADVRSRTLAALPAAAELVALHSNPGPPHTFVDPDTGRFRGLIDFGDAYISHPVLDLWRWCWPAERAAALAGYVADAAVSDDFMRTWQAVGIVADVLLIAQYPDRAGDAIEALQRSLREL
jgi:aminoglycoside phosphotransferase (APT) family kinase protein